MRSATAFKLLPQSNVIGLALWNFYLRMFDNNAKRTVVFSLNTYENNLQSKQSDKNAVQQSLTKYLPLWKIFLMFDWLAGQTLQTIQASPSWGNFEERVGGRVFMSCVYQNFSGRKLSRKSYWLLDTNSLSLVSKGKISVFAIWCNSTWLRRSK